MTANRSIVTRGMERDVVVEEGGGGGIVEFREEEEEEEKRGLDQFPSRPCCGVVVVVLVVAELSAAGKY